MNRNIDKDIQRGKTIIENHPMADLSTEELMSICTDLRDRAVREGTVNAAWDILRDVFYMGVAVGSRNS